MFLSVYPGMARVPFNVVQVRIHVLYTFFKIRCACALQFVAGQDLALALSWAFRGAQNAGLSSWRNWRRSLFCFILFRMWRLDNDVTSLLPTDRWQCPVRWRPAGRYSCWSRQRCSLLESVEREGTVGWGCEACCTGLRLGLLLASRWSPRNNTKETNVKRDIMETHRHTLSHQFTFFSWSCNAISESSVAQHFIADIVDTFCHQVTQSIWHRIALFCLWRYKHRVH